MDRVRSHAERDGGDDRWSESTCMSRMPTMGALVARARVMARTLRESIDAGSDPEWLQDV